ncbi:MAG TPA: hypothetical protein VIA18_05185, partial [Polyangia bacterium]|nr:hypothetical protein [Polyangia bacterium]
MRHALLLATALLASACANGGTSSGDDAGRAPDLAEAAVDLGHASSREDLAPAPRDLANPTEAADLAPPSGAVDLAPAPSGDDLANAPGGDDLAAPGGGDDCFDVTAAAPTVVATAASSDEFAFTVAAQAMSATSWAQVGNEALVLDVLRGSTFVGNLVLHQGATSFTYGMNLGALAAGDTVALRVSTLSAAAATKAAHVCAPTLTSATALGAAGEGLTHAPVFLWPVKKSFDDLPMVLGWSKSTQQYVIVYTNENGGTAVDCGGGAAGVQAEYARWGRGCDIET